MTACDFLYNQMDLKNLRKKNFAVSIMIVCDVALDCLPTAYTEN